MRPAKRFFAVWLAAAAALLLVLGCEEEAIIKKEPAPDFTLKLFDGGEFRSADHKGEAMVVNFFASWCLPCRAEAPHLEKAYREFNIKQENPAHKAAFLGIAIQDTESAAKGFVKDAGITFPAGLDADGKIKEAFGVYGLPTTFFIDKKGVINYTFAGGMTEGLLINELDKIRF